MSRSLLLETLKKIVDLLNRLIEQYSDKIEMANFEKAAEKVLKFEGGYSNNKFDKGNYVCSNMGWVAGSYPYTCKYGPPILIGTMRGIAAPVLAEFLGRIPTVEEMKNLSKQTALEIYRKKYWDRMKGDLITSQKIAELLFDGCVNHGNNTGIKLMQKVLGVAQDGIMGPNTLNAINTGNFQKIYEDYKNERINFYYSLVDARPDQAVFLRGWLNRINNFDDYSGQSPIVLAGLGILIIISLFVKFKA